MRTPSLRRAGHARSVLFGVLLGGGLSAGYRFARDAATARAAAAAVEVDPARERADMVRAHELAVRAHREEPRDVAWADAMEPRVRDLFHAISTQDRFVVTAAECRRRTCAVTLEWPSYAVASEHWRRVVTDPGTAVGCGSRLPLPAPADPSRAYRATALLDCRPPPRG